MTILIQTHQRMTLADGNFQDCAVALTASFEMLSTAAANAITLLADSGFAGAPGDTADDLRLAIARQRHLLSEFCVKVSTVAETTAYTAQATSSFQAYAAAAETQGDTPCGISVSPRVPDHGALSAAHRTLGIACTLESALKNPALNIALNSYARKHARRSIPDTDFKRQAANDRD